MHENKVFAMETAAILVTASIDFHCAPKWPPWQLPCCCYAVTSYAISDEGCMDGWSGLSVSLLLRVLQSPEVCNHELHSTLIESVSGIVNKVLNTQSGRHLQEPRSTTGSS